jgi:hypothetical protein
MLEDPMSGADPSVRAAKNNDILHGSRGKAWIWSLLEIARSEEVEDGGEGLLEKLEHFKRRQVGPGLRRSVCH